MTIPTAVLMKLARLGLTEEQAGAVASMLSEVETATKAESEAVVERSRAKTRDRVQKWREKNKDVTLHNATERNETLRNGSRDPARVEDNLPSEKLSGQEGKKEKNKTRADDLADFKAELSDLDAERLAAIIKLRIAKKGQLSGLAARLFRKDAVAVDMSISEAVDTCIGRGWLTVKPEYLAGRQRPNGHAPPQLREPRNPGERAQLRLLAEGNLPNVTPLNNSRRMDAGDSGGQDEGAGGFQSASFAASLLGRHR